MVGNVGCSGKDWMMDNAEIRKMVSGMFFVITCEERKVSCQSIEEVKVVVHRFLA